LKGRKAVDEVAYSPYAGGKVSPIKFVCICWFASEEKISYRLYIDAENPIMGRKTLSYFVF
jgi:hypothetical protein